MAIYAFKRMRKQNEAAEKAASVPSIKPQNLEIKPKNKNLNGNNNNSNSRKRVSK